MKPVAFRYERPESVEEAVALLAEHGDEAKVLAGGQSLVPMLNMRLARPSVIVDVNRLPLGEIARDNGSWRVGATVRQADPRLLEIPLLAECLPFVGHFVTRNRGTVGGSVAHADAAAELPLALTALGGSVVTSAGRTIPAEEFFVTHFTTALEPGELLVETVWPAHGAGHAVRVRGVRAPPRRLRALHDGRGLRARRPAGRSRLGRRPADGDRGRPGAARTRLRPSRSSRGARCTRPRTTSASWCACWSTAPWGG